jgi:hypothetical protein
MSMIRTYLLIRSGWQNKRLPANDVKNYPTAVWVTRVTLMTR